MYAREIDFSGNISILNNDGTYRAYQKYRYWITCHVSTDQITVMRIRHAKMNPLKYVIPQTQHPHLVDNCAWASCIPEERYFKQWKKEEIGLIHSI
jgi:hypothetical protein